MAEILCNLTTDDVKNPPSGPGAANYTSLSTWEAAQEQDLVAGGNTMVLRCYNDWDTGDGLGGAVNIAGWTSSATNSVTIEAAAGNTHNGIPGTGFRMTASLTTVFRSSIVGLRLRDFQIVSTGTASFASLLLEAGSDDTIIERVIIVEKGTAGSARAGIQAFGGTGDITCRNCLIVNETGVGDQGLVILPDAGLSVVVDSCTIVGGWNRSIVTGGNAAAGTIRNCLAYGGTTLWAQNTQWSTRENNASEDGSAGGNNPVHNVVVGDFVNYAGGDYTPTIDGKLSNAAADLSVSFTDDIARFTRIAWDIGAYENQSAVRFLGPDIVTQTGTENTLFSFDENGEGTVASRFTGASSYALSPDSDALPTGLTVNATTGNIEGTPTEVATRNIIIRGTQ
jgi:hypothetical protein